MQDLEETKREAAQVVELLDLRQGGLTQTLDGGFPELRNSVWQSEVSVQSAVQVRPQPLLHSPCESTRHCMRQAACKSHAWTNGCQGDREALAVVPCTTTPGQVRLPDHQWLLAGSDATDDRKQEKGGGAAQGSTDLASSIEDRDRSWSPGKAATKALQAVPEGNIIAGLRLHAASSV